MRQQIVLLRELQELDLVRKESAIVQGASQPVANDAVDSRVKWLRSQIDSTLLTRYDSLFRQGLAVVEARGGMCMGCMLTVPLGDLNRMKGAKAECVCPNCGRFLAL